MGLSGYLKRLYPEIEHPELTLRAGFRDDHCSRWAPALRNLLWSLDGVEGSAWQTAAYYLPDAQWLVSRQLQEQGAFVFAAKGGHNNEPHNHNDIGHFILYAQGETLLPDLGSGQYSRKYFGPERYEILCNGSQSHSVPIIDGLYQQAGAEHRAELLAYSSNDAEDVFALEISSAYGTTKLKELVRRFTWSKTEPPLLEVTDSYEFVQAPATLVERFMAWHRPQQAEDGRILIAASEEARVFVSYDLDLFDWEVETLHHVNHFDQPETCYALDFKLKPGVLTESNLKVSAAFRFAFQ
nr:heparinase II/III family protein [Paenibacillus aceris]